MMRRRIQILLAMILLAGLVVSGRAGAIYKSKVIFRQGQSTWVKVVKANKKLIPLSHPQTFTPEQMDATLASLRYFRPDAWTVKSAKGKEFDLFTAEERKLIAASLAQAFLQAGPEEWVDFSVFSFRGMPLVGTFRQSDGVMFVKDGKLQVALRNIAERAGADQSQLNTYDPTRGFRALNHLVALPGQTWVADNWVSMDPANIPKAVAAAPVEGVPTPPSVATQPPPKTTEERLLELQQLYDKGLITEDEYKKKREEILNGL